MMKESIFFNLQKKNKKKKKFKAIYLETGVELAYYTVLVRYVIQYTLLNLHSLIF